MITDAGRLLYKICTSHFIARVRKGLLKVCVWEGAGDQTETAIFWPPNLWPSTLCLSRSPDAQPEALGSTLLGAGFLYCILSASSLDPNSSGLPEGPLGRMLLSLPQLVYLRLQLSLELQLNCNSTQLPPTVLTSVLTELYNSSTPTRSPTRSLKLNVQSSSSGKNCHAVHRSLSSSASVYECTMGIFLARPISSANFRPRDFLS